MKLKPLAQIRRRELRIAALTVLQREGIAGATLEKVAAQAGASKGIVLHYFSNKQEVFEQAMREANLALSKVVIEKLRRAQGDIQRLEAIISVNFEERFFQRTVCHAWLSLCAEAPRKPAFARIQHAIHARIDSNLRSALRALMPAEKVPSTALGISVFIDGLWLRKGTSIVELTRHDAILLVQDYVAHSIGLKINLDAT